MEYFIEPCVTKNNLNLFHRWYHKEHYKKKEKIDLKQAIKSTCRLHYNIILGHGGYELHIDFPLWFKSVAYIGMFFIMNGGNLGLTYLA